ncbi:MAG: trypsin-like peptidase domain-containing protein, partial [Trichodesmium sp. MAG_R03]|nr:trypsin-like peptidase domain-containing protein [Trichodesmium sp. MAG_R03]
SVVKDCGKENEKLARLVLLLLTNENNTRPLKSKAELEKESQLNPEKLELVLKIFVDSSLVFLLPENPEDNYQLIHDYLVGLIRQRKAVETLQELKQEQEKRQQLQKWSLIGLVTGLFLVLFIPGTLLNRIYISRKGSQTLAPPFPNRHFGINLLALNRLAENMTVEVVARSVVSGGDLFSSLGSGVIIGKKDSTYYVLSAKHIFLYPNDYRVVVRSKKPGEDAEILKLEIIYRYPDADLAVFKFASVKQYKVAEIGEASQLRKNSQVYVGGWPKVENREGFQFTPAKVTNPRAGDLLTYEPTVPGEGVYPGMSGGAVLNEAGQLIGIHVGLTQFDGDGVGVLVSTFLREIPQQVSKVLVRSTSVGIEKNKITTKLYKGRSFVKEGKVKEAIASYQKAEKIDPTQISAFNWNTLCRYGSLYKKAADVMFACEKAVVLSPKDGDIIDSRGLARALTGDIEGAIIDFQVFVEWTSNEERKAQRQEWIKALQAGENPFTDELLKELR